VSTIRNARDGDARLLQYSAVGGVHYAWTQKDGPFKDPRVRKAWDLLVDREAMVGAISGGNAQTRVGPLSPGFTDFARDQEAIKRDAKADVAEAKRLLEQAGYANGFRAGLLGSSAVEKAWVEWAVQQGKKANIEIVPQVVERTVYLTAQREHKFDLGQIYAIRAYDDPDEYLYPLFHTGASKNYFDISDPALDALIVRQRQTLDAAQRRSVLQEIDSRWTNDFNYHTFAYTETRTDAVKNRLKNYQVRVVSEYSQLRYAWIEQ
jgi:ABC-type transport system substrate-binding protein